MYYWYCGCGSRANKVFWLVWSVFFFFFALALVVGACVAWNGLVSFTGCSFDLFQSSWMEVTNNNMGEMIWNYDNATSACQYAVATVSSVSGVVPGNVLPDAAGANGTEVIYQQCLECFEIGSNFMSKTWIALLLALVAFMCSLLPCVFFCCCGAHPRFYPYGESSQGDGQFIMSADDDLPEAQGAKPKV